MNKIEANKTELRRHFKLLCLPFNELRISFELEIILAFKEASLKLVVSFRNSMN